jgi:hypothetical protein
MLDWLGLMPDDGCMAGMKKDMAGFGWLTCWKIGKRTKCVVVGDAAVWGGKYDTQSMKMKTIDDKTSGSALSACLEEETRREKILPGNMRQGLSRDWHARAALALLPLNPVTQTLLHG